MFFELAKFKCDVGVERIHLGYCLIHLETYENIEKLLNIGHPIGMPRSTNCKYVLDV